jgi:hypothetical protein
MEVESKPVVAVEPKTANHKPQLWIIIVLIVVAMTAMAASAISGARAQSRHDAEMRNRDSWDRAYQRLPNIGR